MRDTWNTAIKISDIRTEDRERFASLGIDFSSFSNCYILPGFADVHVHLREPGFLYKETIQTGTMAAAAGGFTDIFSMPNLDPDVYKRQTRSCIHANIWKSTALR